MDGQRIRTGLIVGDKVYSYRGKRCGIQRNLVGNKRFRPAPTSNYKLPQDLAAGSGGVAAANTEGSDGLVDFSGVTLNDGTALVTGGRLTSRAVVSFPCSSSVSNSLGGERRTKVRVCIRRKKGGDRTESDPGEGIHIFSF